LVEFNGNEEGDAMRHSEILLILTIIVISNSAQATLVACPACEGGQPDWTASATAFLEGRPINDTPILGGPKGVRLLNEQINFREKANQASNAAGKPEVTSMRNSISMLDISLNDIRAVPNPANSSDAVKIMAIFRNISRNSTTPDGSSMTTDLTGIMVYAGIKNSAGLEVGRVNLKRSSENEYDGFWNARVASDVYNASIRISGYDGTKTFNDVLQIVINASENTTNRVHAIRKLG